MDVILPSMLMTVDGPAAAEPTARRTADGPRRLGLSALAALAEPVRGGRPSRRGDTAGMSATAGCGRRAGDTCARGRRVAAAVRALPHLLAHDLPRRTPFSIAA